MHSLAFTGKSTENTSSSEDSDSLDIVPELCDDNSDDDVEPDDLCSHGVRRAPDDGTAEDNCVICGTVGRG